MMKKVWLILLAVVLVFGLGVLGCSDDGGSGKGKGTGTGEGDGDGNEEPFFFKLGAFDDGKKTWCTNGVDGVENDLTEEIFCASKYLILEMMSKADENGIGGIQIGMQGGSSWDWKDYTVSGDWKAFAWLDYNNEDKFYVVIDLSSMAGWAATSSGGGAKLIFNSLFKADGVTDNHPQITFICGYLTNADLVMPDSKADAMEGTGGKCWAAKEVPEMPAE
jgi:hypothetical protein